MFGKGLQVVAIASLTILASCQANAPRSSPSPTPDTTAAVSITVTRPESKVFCEDIRNVSETTKVVVSFMPAGAVKPQMKSVAPGEAFDVCVSYP